MINYVNNSYDNVLKPCDAQKFCTLTQSSQTERLILAHRAGEPKAKGKLPALTYMGVFDKEKYKSYLAKCEAQGTRPLSPRHAEFMRPTGLLMLDFDHIPNPQVLYEQLVSKMDKARLALAHITPSGQGLRLVLQREKGKSIEQEQYEFCRAMDVKCDDVCKDISRLSFAPMQKEVLYYNPSLLFGELPEAGDYPDEGAPLFSPQKGGSPNIAEHQPTMTVSSPSGGVEGASFPTDYNGIEYGDIVKRLEEQLGGRPEHGARNSFIFSMACNLRYICNDDAQWIASILPTYGEDPQKHRTTIQSAVNRPMSRTMPETLKRALGVAKVCADNGQQTTDNRQRTTVKGLLPPCQSPCPP